MCIGGLRPSVPVLESFEKHGFCLPVVEWKERMKSITNETLSLALNLKNELAPETPSFLHSSCAISYCLGIADYNGHGISKKNHREVCDLVGCPAEQRKRCFSKEPPSKTSVTEFLRLIQSPEHNFDITPEGILFDEELEYATHYKITHACGWPVLARSYSRWEERIVTDENNVIHYV